MKSLKIFIAIAFLITYYGCSVFQATGKEETAEESSDNVEEVYVFDDVTDESDEDRSAEIKELEKELDNTLNKEEQTEEVDVFDEPVVDVPEQSNMNAVNYYLQLGAFSSLKNAEEFASKIESDVPFNLSITYNAKTTFYNVSSTAYSTREEVERIKKSLFEKNLFKDAFIVTQ